MSATGRCALSGRAEATDVRPGPTVLASPWLTALAVTLNTDGIGAALDPTPMMVWPPKHGVVGRISDVSSFGGGIHAAVGGGEVRSTSSARC